MPRLYREAPLNAIWEGSGNVIALDILRTMHKEPAALAAFMDEIADARSADARLDTAAREVETRLSSGLAENQARWAAERMALLLQASLLVRHAPPAVADAFCATRLAGDWGHSYGTLPAGADVEGIVARQLN